LPPRLSVHSGSIVPSDRRLSSGRFAADIDWQDQMIRNRAEAIVNRTAPDTYLWGGSSS
jgi:hypothetical protein